MANNVSRADRERIGNPARTERLMDDLGELVQDHSLVPVDAHAHEIADTWYESD